MSQIKPPSNASVHSTSSPPPINPAPIQGKGIIGWFTQNPVAANLLMLVILVLGLATLLSLRQEGFPSLPPKHVTVSVPFSSGSAVQAEEGIAIKVEETIQDVPGIKQMISESTAEGATVTIEKQSGHDLQQLLTDVKNRVDAIASFPSRAEKPVITATQWNDHAIWVQVFGESDRDTLQTLAGEIRLALLRQPAIHNVVTEGARRPEMSIEVDETRLQAYGLSLSQVAEAIANESLTDVSGQLRSEQGSLSITADRQGYFFSDFASIPLLTKADGSVIRLGDVTQVRDNYEQDDSRWMRFQGQPSIGLQVIMDNRGDINAIVEQANAVVDEWQRNGRLPVGIQVASWYDQSQFIQSRLALMVKNGVSGIALVILVLALFLNLRVAFWVAMGLPVCFAGTFLLMGENLLNLSINELTTFGLIIALGIVVDDAVVVGESIYASREQHGDTVSSTIHGVHRVAVPTIFGVLTTVAAFGPLALVTGELGQIFAQFAIIVVVCLLFSLMESKLILPAHLAHIRTQRTSVVKNPLTKGWSQLQRGVAYGMDYLRHQLYLPVLVQAVRYRYATLLVFIAVWVASIGLLTSGTVRYVFFPDVPGDVISGYFMLQEGAGHGLTRKHTETLENAIQTVNQELVEEYGLEQPVVANLQTYMQGDLVGEVTVELSSRELRPVTTNEIASRWRERVGSLEATEILKFVSTWISTEDLRIELLANDTEQLRSAGETLKSVLASLPGVEDIQDNLKPGAPQLRLTLTPEGHAMGLTTADLARQIQQAYYGFEVQRLQRGRDEVKVWVRYPQAQRSDSSTLAQARIRTPQGAVLPLFVVASIEEGYADSYITRIDGQRANFIVGNVDKQITSPNEVIGYLEQQVFPELRVNHPGLHIQLAGEAKEDAEATASMGKIFGLLLMLIYVLLAVPLKSYSQPLLIMAAIPFGIMGAIVGHWVQDLPVSLLSLFGILALSGIVVNDSLLLVARYNQLKAQGVKGMEALIEAGSSRLRAIILTSLTTFVGLFPLLQETSEQAQFLIPTVASLAYGILFATLISLILIPVLIRILEDVRFRAPMMSKDKHKTDNAKEREPLNTEAA